MNKNVKNIIFSLSICSVLLLMSICSVFMQEDNHKVYAYDTTDKIIFEDNSLNVVSEDELSNSENDKELPNLSVTIQLQENEDLEMISQQKPALDATVAEVDKAILTQRELVREINYLANQEFAEKIDFNDEMEMQISEYSPFIFLSFSDQNLTKERYETICELAEEPEIKKIYIGRKEEAIPEVSSAMSTVNVANTVNAGTLTGKDVNIGILDGGIVDKSSSEFTNRNLTIRNHWLYTESVSSHATNVMKIAGGNSGIARKANLFSVEAYGEPSGEIEWLLSKNVNIINTSYMSESSNEAGTYTSQCAYVDYIIRNNWVTMVGSAGNSNTCPNLYVTTFKTAYNYITVGNSGSGSTTRSASSCYRERSGYNLSKPTLMAPGQMSFGSGTSYSSPMVVGCLALMMEKYPAMKSYPEVCIAAVTASAKPMATIYTNFDSSGLEDEIGAGCLDFNKLQEAFKQYTAFNRYTTDNSGLVPQYLEFSVNSGNRIRAASAWLVQTNKKTTNYGVTDYDLRLYRVNGSSETLVKSITGTANNVEFIDYTATVSGIYRLRIYQYGKPGTTDYVSMSYVIR